MRALSRLAACDPTPLIVTDRSWRTSAANAAFCALFACAESDLLGRRSALFDAAPGEDAATRPDCALVERGQRWRGEVIHRRGDGRLLTLSCTVFPITAEDGALLAYCLRCDEVAARTASSAGEQVHESIRISEARLREAQRIAKLGNWEWDIVADTLHWSDEIFRIFGLDPLGFSATYRAFLQRVHPDDREFVDCAVAAALGGASYSIDHRIVLPDGQLKHVHEEAVVVFEGGRPVRMHGTVQDTSERTRLEFELRQAQKLEAIGRFGAGIAHDFNNLLATISNSAGLLKWQLPQHGEERAVIDTILDTTRVARDVVEQMLHFTRPESSERKVIALGDAVEQALARLRVGLPASIVVDAANLAADALVEAEPVELQQILLNLCTNAVDAMRATGGRLTVSVRVVRSESADGAPPAASHVELRVSDTGPGILAHRRDKVFEPFFTTKPKGKGAGLGLSIVRGIVDRLRGSVALDSEEGRGVSATVILPLAPAGKVVAIDEERRAARPSGGTVLLVDDDETLLGSARRLLTAAGYRVTAAAAAAEALALFRAQPGVFDVVVTDQSMPDTTGIELTSALMAIDPGAKVVLCSGYVETDFSAGLPAAIKGILRKPYGPEECIEAIERALARPGPS